nr:MAG TPA: hypothetical protein [Caudoviricetes sp.]
MPSTLFALPENERAFVYACMLINSKQERDARDKAKGR